MKSLIAAIALFAGLSPFAAAEVTAATKAAACAPEITNAIIRMPPGAPRMMAGYFRIDNPCSKAMVLNEARSASFGDVQIHQTVIVGDVARMRYYPSLTIAKGDRAIFEQGGLHLMLMKPKGTIRPGQKINVRLSGPGWSRNVAFTVQSMVD